MRALIISIIVVLLWSTFSIAQVSKNCEGAELKAMIHQLKGQEKLDVSFINTLGDDVTMSIKDRVSNTTVYVGMIKNTHRYTQRFDMSQMGDQEYLIILKNSCSTYKQVFKKEKVVL